MPSQQYQLLGIGSASAHKNIKNILHGYAAFTRGGVIAREYLKKMLVKWDTSNTEIERRLYVDRDDVIGSIRSFAIVAIHNDYFMIHVICSALHHSMTRRSNRPKLTGIALLKRIELDATQRQGIKYIQLYALDTVLSYYINQGYQFTQGHGHKYPIYRNIECILRDVMAIRWLQVSTEQTNNCAYKESVEDEVIVILNKPRGIRRFLTQFYTEPDLKMSIHNLEEWKDDKMNHGYGMMKCIC